MRRRRPERIVRPTLRCLLEDLGAEVEPAELAEALNSAATDLASDPRYLFPLPLTEVEHLVLDKANRLAQDDSAHRERIDALSRHGVIKVKTSDRRGALWQDPEGTWWLLAAGRRKDDGPGDFYRDVERFGGSLDRLAPTDADLRYHRYESAYLTECEREREAQHSLLRTMLVAAEEPGTRQEVDLFGAVVSVLVEDDDESATLTLSFEFTSFEEQDRFPVDLIAFVPGHENIDDWDYLPALRPGDPASWYTLVHPSWIETLAVAEELDRLIGQSGLPSGPEIEAKRDLAHMAPASAVTVGYIEGTEIVALCGARFTPHRDPEAFEICQSCREALGLLRAQHPHA